MNLKNLKIAIAQLDYHTGNFDYNTQKIISHIKKAQEVGADLIVFSELCVCGYPPRDFLEFDDFIDQCQLRVDEIAKHCVGIAAIVGSPSKNPNIKGKDLFNSAFLLVDGKVAAIRSKTLLPNYDIFDEYRYFEPNHNFEIINLKGVKIALTVCEDLWNVEDNPMYQTNPMDELIKQQPDLMINIAASPFNKNQQEIRTQVMKTNVTKYNMPLFYVNHIGAQTQLIFDGGSMVVNQHAEVIDNITPFEEQQRVYTFTSNNGKTEIIPLQTTTLALSSTIERIYNALVLGIREYFLKQGFTKAILGLSGGIDSAVVICLAAEALGAENVRAMLLPSAYSSQHSIDDAITLAKNLGTPHDTINIETTYQA